MSPTLSRENVTMERGFLYVASLPTLESTYVLVRTQVVSVQMIQSSEPKKRMYSYIELRTYYGCSLVH